MRHHSFSFTSQRRQKRNPMPTSPTTSELSESLPFLTLRGRAEMYELLYPDTPPWADPTISMIISYEDDGTEKENGGPCRNCGRVHILRIICRLRRQAT